MIRSTEKERLSQERRGPQAILEVDDVHAGYGKKEILHGVSLSLAAGEIVALIGPNGAGKSTLLKVVAGLVRTAAGRVLFRGMDLTTLPTHRRARAGIAYLMQGGAVFPTLSTEDHLKIGRATARWGNRRTRPDEADLLQQAVRRRGSDPAGLFSGGERQALAAATVLAGEPALLLADEPSAGLAPLPAGKLLERLAAASRERQIPILWVEQRIAEILALADRALMLRGGRIAAETSDPRSWLGGDILSHLTFGEEA